MKCGDEDITFRTSKYRILVLGKEGETVGIGLVLMNGIERAKDCLQMIWFDIEHFLEATTNILWLCTLSIYGAPEIDNSRGEKYTL